MIIGDQKEFAIQFQLNAISSGEWLFGKCCFWIGGLEVGSFALGESLRDFLFSLEELLKFDRSFNSELMQPCANLFQRLNNAAYLGTEVWDGASRFIFAPNLESFGQVKIFMIEKNNKAWFIFSESPYLHVREYRCKQKKVRDVMELTIYELDKLLNDA